ncbi:MAG: cation:proton antiporter [Candidatus Rokuibacteriota bacterium]
MDLVASIGISIIVAAALAGVAQRLRQPLIIGYIVTGALLGPQVGLGVIHDEANIEQIAEIGLVLLLFLIGLELSLPRLLQAGRVITVSGLLKVPICAAVAWFVLAPVAAFTAGPFDRLYLAIGTGFASTLILVKLLSDKRELTTFAGRVTLGILVFEDLYAIAFLALQPNLTRLHAGSLIMSLGTGAALLGAAILAGRFALAPLFRAIAKSSELMIVTTMAWCFLVSGAAGWAGLSKEMGALIAGVLIASFPYGTEVVPRITGIRDVFITLFFVALGLKVPSPSPQLLLLAVAVAVFVTVVQFVATYPLFAVLRLDLRTASVVGINLGQISEFSLIVFTLGVGYQHVSQEAASLVLYTLLLTTVVSTYSIQNNQRLAGALAHCLGRLGLGRWFGSDAPAELAGDSGHRVQRRGDEVFLLGLSGEGFSLVDYLRRHALSMKQRLVAIDVDTQMLERLRSGGIEAHYGDISNVETLRQAGIEKAAVVVSGMSDWFLKGTSNLQLLRQVRALNVNARLVVTADNVEDAEGLYAAGADYVFLPAILTAEHLKRALADGSPDALGNARRLQAAELFGR